MTFNRNSPLISLTNKNLSVFYLLIIIQLIYPDLKVFENKFIINLAGNHNMNFIKKVLKSKNKVIIK
jgi:hypothetical protein